MTDAAQQEAGALERVQVHLLNEADRFTALADQYPRNDTAALWREQAEILRGLATTPAHRLPDDLEGLCERLEARQPCDAQREWRHLRNPDGPEAARAIAALSADNARLREERDKAVDLLREIRPLLAHATDGQRIRIAAFLSARKDKGAES